MEKVLPDVINRSRNRVFAHLCVPAYQFLEELFSLRIGPYLPELREPGGELGEHLSQKLIPLAELHVLDILKSELLLASNSLPDGLIQIVGSAVANLVQAGPVLVVVRHEPVIRHRHVPLLTVEHHHPLAQLQVLSHIVFV